jgi:thymidylate kinase
MFIVFDAIDGAGKGYQREAVTAILAEKFNLKVKGQEFPVHNAFYETVIHPALQQEKAMNSASWVLSYLLDKTLEAEEIRGYLNNKSEIYIADGYFTTTLAYQGYLMSQVSVEKLIEYSIDFEIPKPDLAIYIDVDPKVAMQRKEIEEGHDEGLDIFEKDLSKQIKLRDIFNKMVDEEVYCKWVKVDGNGSKEEVTEKIIEVLKKEEVI